VVPARSWRAFLWPTAFLLAITIAVIGLRAAFQDSAPATRPKVVHRAPTASYYRVRPGDTLTVVAAKTGVSTARLLRLNPKVQPTALFIGQKIRLR
jgi:LysM repeat protein